MKIVIVGAGDVGTHIARDLANTHDIVVVDTDANRTETLGSSLDVSTVEGDGRSLETLKEATIKEADVVIASTDDDSVNVMVCGAATNLTDAFTVARVRSTDLFETWQNVESVFGIDLMLRVDALAAEAIIRTVAFPGALAIYTFVEGHVEMGEFAIGADDPLANQTIEEADQFPALTFAGVLRGNDVLIPSGETVIQPHDRVVVIGSPSAVRRFATRQATAEALDSEDDIVIIGGGSIGRQTARLLEDRGYAPRLIEHDPERADILTDKLSTTTVIEGEATSFELLTDNHVDEADLAISTLDDETNYIVSLLANRLGVAHTTAVVDEREYVDLFEAAGVNTTIQPHTVIAEEITRATRQRIDDLAILENDSAEVLEISVDEESLLAGESLADVAHDFPDGFVVGAISRGGSLVTPRGNTVIQTDDHVVAFVDTAVFDDVTTIALRKHIVGESEHLSKSMFECFFPWFAEKLAA